MGLFTHLLQLMAKQKLDVKVYEAPQTCFCWANEMRRVKKCEDFVVIFVWMSINCEDCEGESHDL